MGTGNMMVFVDKVGKLLYDIILRDFQLLVKTVICKKNF